MVINFQMLFFIFLISFGWMNLSQAQSPFAGDDEIVNESGWRVGVSSSVAQPTSSEELVRNFTEVLATNSPNRVRHRRAGRRHEANVNVEVYELPTQVTEDGQVQTVCGSQHIRSHRSKPHMNRTSACMLMGMAQQWRREFCPENTPDCQLMIGDSTFGHGLGRDPSRTTWPHRTHRRGWCVDIWPIRKPGYSGELALDRTSHYESNPGYDRQRTRQLIELMHNWGSDTPGGGASNNQIFFNDPSFTRRSNGQRPVTRYIAKHFGHIHVCFRDNQENRDRCARTEFDPQICPGLGSNPTQPSEGSVPQAVEASSETSGNSVFGVEF